MNILEELKNNSKKFNKIVLWGFKTKWHTHRFIFQAYYNTLKKAGISVIWVDDDKKNAKMIEKDDLIISASGMHGKMVPEKKSIEDYNLPIRDDIFYCLHGENSFFREKLNFDRTLELYYFSSSAEIFEKINDAVYFDRKNKNLYQPWGTNLLPNEFKKPVFRKNRLVFWIGSIWNDKNNHGNKEEIGKFVDICKKNKLIFVHLRFIPNFMNEIFIRFSRLAPAIGGRRQVEINYLPCRMFKNISYGQLGFSNVKKFSEIFVDCNIYNESIEETVNKILKLTKDEYINLIKKQQEVCKNYTIAHNLNNIFKYIN